MRKIRANAIAILTVAWILGTFYYLWRTTEPRGVSGGRAQEGGREARAAREDRTIPLIVVLRCAQGG